LKDLPLVALLVENLELMAQQCWGGEWRLLLVHSYAWLLDMQLAASDALWAVLSALAY